MLINKSSNKRNTNIWILAILLLLTALYGVFWSFKARLYEQRINDIVASIAASKVIPDKKIVMNGDVKVSGFPMMHKIDIKNLTLGNVSKKYRVVLNHIEIEIGAFSSDFLVRSLGPIFMEDKSSNFEGSIDFNSGNKISGVISGDKISQLKYVGSGFRIFDEKKNVLFTVESKNGKIIFLNDTIPQSIISNDGYKILDARNEVIFVAESFLIDTKYVDSEQYISKNVLNIKNYQFPTFAKSPENQDIKNNLIILSATNISPNEKFENISAQTSMYQQKLAPYIFNIELEDFEFSNSLYKISMNGQASNFPDGAENYGSILARIENLDNLTKNIVSKVRRISGIEEELSDHSSKAPDRSSIFAAMALQFLDNLHPTLKDVAAKNPLSKNGLSVFEIKKERGEEFLINNVAPMEILALLMKKIEKRDVLELN
ncbi:MAG: hypothetical protein ACJAZX_001236 [Rickettsiales bacterium]|jgi:hypothetical protein